jgi:Na+/proline symporter
LAVVLLIYVTAGGLRAIANVDTVQGLLLAAGIVVIGVEALHLVGGYSALNRALAKIASAAIGNWGSTLGRGGGDFNAGFAIPGVIQWSAGLGREAPVGGIWTGVMCLTFMFAFMGIQAGPAFSMWAFASKSPRSFAPQQVWASALAVGLILICFTTIQGMAAHLLGGNPAVTIAGMASADVIPDLTGGRQVGLVPYYIRALTGVAPWLVGFLAVCALAALQASGAASMATAGAMLSRDIYRRYLNPDAKHRSQILVSRVSILIVTVLALLMATYAQDAIAVFGGLALALVFQLWVPLLGVTWIPWITRQGATYGLAAGIIGVVLTDGIGQKITGNSLPWGVWPWTIHSAGWGIVANVLICVLASSLSQNGRETAHRMKYHHFLREHAGLPATKQRLVTLAWVLTIVWVFFGVGPGLVIGNYVFGAPGAGYAGWIFGMPSIWAWLILWWGLGIILMWFLAYKMELSTVPSKQVVVLSEDFKDSRPASFFS